MPWIYKGEVFSDVDKYVGFVYIITNLRTDKKYIGKKLFHFAKTKQVKGKKKRYKVDSDWQDYFGSNDELNEHVKVLGPDAFRREIIRLCTSKGEMSYFEAKYQFQYDVLESDQWYNTWIMCKVHRKHLTFLKGEVKNASSTQKPAPKRPSKDRVSKAQSKETQG